MTKIFVICSKQIFGKDSNIYIPWEDIPIFLTSQDRISKNLLDSLSLARKRENLNAKADIFLVPCQKTEAA